MKSIELVEELEKRIDIVVKDNIGLEEENRGFRSLVSEYLAQADLVFAAALLGNVPHKKTIADLAGLYSELATKLSELCKGDYGSKKIS